MLKRRVIVLLTGALASLAMVTLGTPWVAATIPPHSAHASSLPREDCQEGELCLWQRAAFQGERRTHVPARTDIDDCTPLARGTEAVAFANLTGLPVTVYESGTCDTTDDFRTYPSGSWVPEAPYDVRAFTIWKR